MSDKKSVGCISRVKQGEDPREVLKEYDLQADHRWRGTRTRRRLVRLASEYHPATDAIARREARVAKAEVVRKARADRRRKKKG